MGSGDFYTHCRPDFGAQPCQLSSDDVHVGHIISNVLPHWGGGRPQGGQSSWIGRTERPEDFTGDHFDHCPNPT